jgi:NADP-dependent 3-hydroxy acid dehydrogenase YdfG
MTGSDSLQLVISEIGNSIREVTETFALIGLAYVSKLSLNFLCKSFYGVKVFIIPRLFKNDKWLKSMGDWAIVTGCTHGIGLGYAKELAKKGLNLILISRNEATLAKVSTSLGIFKYLRYSILEFLTNTSYLESRYKIKTIRIAADLNDNTMFEKIEKIVLAHDIGILINNVGTSSEPGLYHLTTNDSIERIINLNIRCLTSMTRIVLPNMVKK